jgi:hypothetical protein
VTSSVDEFVKTRILPELQPVAEMIRGLMREMAPEAKEGVGYGIPVWKAKRIIAVISPTKKDITFSLSRGAQFEDKYGLLRGVGKSSKHVKIKNVDGANKEALKYYIRQAIELDER